MKTILILISLFFSSFLFSQNLNLEWAKKINGVNNETVQDFLLDSQKNIYTLGSFDGTIDIDPGNIIQSLISSGNDDIFIQKLDSAGHFIWGYKLGSSGNDNGYSIQINSNNEIIISGEFIGTVDFDNSSNINSLYSQYISTFILKIDSNGNFIWVKILEGIGLSSASIRSMAIDGQNNIYVGGSFSGTCDFDPSNSVVSKISNGTNDVYILKLDSSGNFIWVKSMGGFSSEEITEIKLDNFSNLYITGFFSGSGDYDPGLNTTTISSSGLNDYAIFLGKYNQLGDLVWIKSFDSPAHDIGNSIDISTNNFIYITGAFSQTIDFNDGTGVNNLTSNGLWDCYIAKYDLNGDFIWAQSVGGNSSDQGTSIYTGLNNEVYITGFFNGIVDADFGSNIYNINSLGGADIFIIKVDNTDSFSWANTIGGLSNQYPNKIKTYNSNLYIGGWFESTTDFDPNLSIVNLISDGNRDGYIAKYSTCLNSSNTITTSNCETYTAPDGQIFTNSGTYNVIIPNHSGCDSLITINLTIKHNSSNTITTSNCETYTAPDGQVFTNSGTYNVVIPNHSGCDSLITINLTIKHNSSNTITTSNCETYTAPDGQIFTNSGTYNVVIPNHSGCDSLITINLTIKHNSSNTITTSNCETYTAPDGQVFTNSGTYNVVIPNHSGCDSLITINLTIKHNSSNTITTSNCETYTAPDGQIFTNSGTYNVVIPNHSGCDSLITINLTIKHNSSNTITTSNCETYTAPDGQVFTNSGTYNVVISNDIGCDSLITINLTINNNPIVFAGNDTSVCEQSIITLHGHGANNYVWNKNIIDNVPFTPLNSGYYTVIGTDLNGCSDSDSVMVNLFQLPIANFTNSTNSISDISQIINFINTSSGATDYFWNFGDGITDSTVNVSHDFNVIQLDSFKVELIAISAQGCVDSAYRWIYFTKSNDIFIPTGFSPNNDNQNDDWKIKGIEKFNEAKISVFNRWGQLLFEGNNINSSWNGIYNNELLPTGDYYFIIDLGNNQKYNGVVTLKQ